MVAPARPTRPSPFRPVPGVANHTDVAAPTVRTDVGSIVRVAGWVGAGVWAGVVAVGVAWGTWRVADSGVALRAAPLMGRWELRAGLGLVPAVILGLVVVAWGPVVAARARWRVVRSCAALVGAGWTVALAASDGWSRVTEPLTTEHEYEPLAERVHRLVPFLDGYVDQLAGYPIHVQGHPPGPVVVAWVLDLVGLRGAGWLALLAIATWGVAVAAVLEAARSVAGERSARRAAPALAVLPAAVWAGTSLDALFAGLVALGIALVAGAGRLSSDGRAAAGGAVLGGALLCSYGVVPLLVMAPAAVFATAAARPCRIVAVAVAAGAAALGLAAAGGFWWPDGLAATHEAYWASIAADRPAVYLTVAGNPAALAFAVGPATAAGLAATFAGAGWVRWVARVRARLAGGPEQGWRMTYGLQPPAVGPGSGGRAGRMPAPLPGGPERGGRTACGLELPARRSEGGLGQVWVLPGAALVAVAIADLSQLSRGEVERIWLPFVCWLALAAPGDGRGWLAAQVGVAIVVQSVLASPW